MTGLIILAAGPSSRLGLPKQNLIYKGQTLLQRAVDEAIASVCHPIIVVLGANAEAIRPTVLDKPISIIYNPDWQEGMASSIRLGILGLQNIDPEISAVVLMLCDQPFVNSQLIDQLIEINSKKGIVASAYNETAGVPILFEANYFYELLSLNGQEGAKKLLVKYEGDLITVPFLLGSIDIDTVDDFEKLLKE